MTVRLVLSGRLAAIATMLLMSCDGDVSLVPAEGSKHGGIEVRIEGHGFSGHGPPVVHFGQTPAKAVVIESDQLIRIKTPEAEALGTVDVTVTFADGSSHHLPHAFTYIEPPALEIVAPRG